MGKNAIVVVGSIALDSVKTPYGEVKEALGGSATYFTLAARLYAGVKLVGVVGRDFPKKYLALLAEKNTILEGLVTQDGKTFRWSGSYMDLNEAITHDTQLNVFADFNPSLPKSYLGDKFLFLANIHPLLQEKVLHQASQFSVIAADTMNLWIKNYPNDLLRLYRNVHIVFLNDREARMLSGEESLIQAARKISSHGPQWVIIKKGEHGVIAYHDKHFFSLPAYPIEKVIDPTGAGDSFAGAFMGVLAKSGGLDTKTVLEALRYATVTASFTVQDFSVEALRKIDQRKLRSRLEKYMMYSGLAHSFTSL